MHVNDIYHSLAEIGGLTDEQVKTGIQDYINHLHANLPNEQAAARFAEIPSKGKIPTSDEFVRFAVNLWYFSYKVFLEHCFEKPMDEDASIEVRSDEDLPAKES